jgi:hypothetical protein
MLKPSTLVKVSVDVGQILLDHQLMSGRRVNPVGSQRRSDAQHDFAQGRDGKPGRKTPLVPDSRSVSVRRLLQRVPITEERIMSANCGAFCASYSHRVHCRVIFSPFSAGTSRTSKSRTVGALEIKSESVTQYTWEASRDWKSVSGALFDTFDKSNASVIIINVSECILKVGFPLTDQNHKHSQKTSNESLTTMARKTTNK